MEIKESQRILLDFVKKNKWRNFPLIDQFDHFHEELIELSKLFRYKDLVTRRKILKSKKKEIEDGVLDLYVNLLLLSNQLKVNLEDVFVKEHKKLLEKLKGK